MTRKAFLAGVLISFGCLFSISAAPYGNVVQGLCFSVGLFGVLFCGARLFTGSVLQVERVWDNDESVCSIAAEWLSIWNCNLRGAFTIALMALVMGFDASAIAQAKAALPWHELIVRAFMCNVMVCMAVWSYQHSDPFGDSCFECLAACILPVACFVACGYEHSVADMLYMPLGYMLGAVSALDMIRVIVLATIGNLIGGISFAWLVRE